MKLKKSGSIGNKARKCNIWCTKKVMGMNMINGLWNQDCLMQKK